MEQPIQLMTRISITLTFFLFMLPLLVFAQPVNDDCDGIIDLGVAPACPDSVFFTNVDATASDIGVGNIPECFSGGTTQNDVWFMFTTSDTIFDYTITVTGLSDMGSNPLSNPQVAIYRGDCSTDNLAELGCESAEEGSDFVEIDIIGLTPNIPYFIRVNDYSASATPNWGTFQLCVDEMEPASTIDQGSSTACSGILYDSGGEDGDYQNDEDYTFTICPDQPHECIVFTLDYYFIEQSTNFDLTDQLTIYDGDTPSPGNIIGQVGGSDFANDGGGGVCYMVQATSGCMTINFTSDSNASFEGFAGEWYCTTDCPELLPITIEQNIPDEQIVEFVSTGATVAEISSINCPPEAYGTFLAGDNSDLGLERGLVMTTGSALNTIGPNNIGSQSTINDGVGDADLDYLSTVFGDGTLSENACIIELDVLAATNELTFEYVFGSEEYPEYVNDVFNDIFAFLISGPGITGDPNIANQENIAILPNGMDTPVQINSVNNLQNWEYYRDNTNGLSLQYDGLTSDAYGIKKSLTAIAQVQPCSTYHLKFAIADRGDASFDSGVFISELKGGTPNLSVKFNSGIDYLVEDCVNEPDEVLIELNTPVEDTTSYVVVIGGTATPDVDYIFEIPDTVTLLPGQSTLSFPITALSDLIIEPTETITIALTNDFGCGEVTYTEVVVDLQDEIVVDIAIEQDTALVCQDSSLVLEVDGAASYFWSPVSVFDNPTSSTPTASPTMSQWVSVEGIVGPCIDYDSVYLQIVDPEIMAEALDPVVICQGDVVQLQSTNNVNDQNLVWTPSAGLDDPNSPNPVATPQTTTDYIVSVEVAGCFVFDTVSIDVSPFDFPDVIADTVLCQNYDAQLASTILPDTTTTTFVWTPNIALDNDSIAGAIASPMTTTSYTLIATSENGACADTAEVLVEVFPANVEISNPDSTEICLGETVTLTASTSTGSETGLFWSPDNGTLSDTVGFTVTATPEVSGWYYSSFTIAQCTVFDSVYIRVDSLPDLSIVADPDDQPYCQGEIITLSSPVYEPGFYPDIEHMWTEGLGFETPDTLFNMVFSTQDTLIYQRVTTNRACSETVEILINVIEPPVTNIIPQDTAICLGESVQLQLEIIGQYDEVTWNGDGLSCTDCLDPVATPSSSGTANYDIEISADDCTTNISTSFEVADEPTVDLNPTNTICLGAGLMLNLANDNNSTYTWTSTDPDFGTVTDPQPFVTPDETTTYSLIAIANDGVCPPFEADITIEVIEQAAINLTASALTICEGEDVTLGVDVTNGNNSDVFVWTNSSNDDVELNQSFTDTPTESTTYQLQFTSGEGCDTLTEEIFIEVLPPPAEITDIEVVNLDGSNDQILIGHNIQLSAVYTTTSTDDLTFSWYLDTTLIASGIDLETIETQALQGGELNYTLVIESPIGCSEMFSIIVTVNAPVFGVPNIFTPNGDEMNDFFNIAPEESMPLLEVMEFKVYNRWGQLVYDNDTPDTGWDGTYNDKPQPIEVYFYSIKIAYLSGESAGEFQGNVTLAR